MKATEVSRTAQYIALFRAIETQRPKNKRLFDDTLASAFLDPGLKLAVKFTSWPVIGNWLVNYIQKRGVGALSMGIGRTKYIDDLLKQAVQDGAKQVIILGAGFDTRGMRLGFLKNSPVIEIDHPNTSKYKLNVFKSLQLILPQNIKYLQLDFNKQGLLDFAIKNNLDFSIPTAFIWEGVSSYLKADAVDKTFEFVNKFPSGTSIIFTYLHKQVLDDPKSIKGAEKMTEILNKEEEQWTFGFYPEQLPDYLKTYDLKIIEDKNANDIRKMYLSDRQSLLSGFGFHRIAFAKKQ